MTTAETAQGGTETKTTKTTAAKAVKHCACLTGTGQSCDRVTQKAFAQGHDARMASRLAQAVASDDNEMTADQAEKLIRDAGGSDLLVGKMRHSAELRRAGKSGKQTKKSGGKAAASKEAGHAQADSEEARAMATAGNSLLGSKVKVKHGEGDKAKEYDAVVVKNASQVVVARHRLIGQNCDHSVDDQGVTGAKIK